MASTKPLDPRSLKGFDITKYKFSAEKRPELIFLARTAESAERYEDMCDIMRELVQFVSGKNEHLSVEERNLISVAYKNVVGAYRASYRQLQLSFDDGSLPERLSKEYIGQIEGQLHDFCRDILKLLADHLIPIATTGSSDTEEVVFYRKMEGDYYRYLAEFITSSGYDKKSAEAYEAAMQAAEDMLPTHPIRLGLALNYSVCFYEILKDKKKACELAKKAFDDAISKLDTLDEASYKDSTLIMQLLRDNLTLWTSNEDALENEETEAPAEAAEANEGNEEVDAV